jgi:DNA-binding phage protein
MDRDMIFQASDAIASHLNAAIDEGGAVSMLYALGDVIKAKGEEQMASLAGCTLKELHAVGNPSKKPAFSVVHGIVHGLGLRIVFIPLGDAT